MPRDGAITFSDLIGKLDALHIACDKCGRWLLCHAGYPHDINWIGRT
jgi:hypothetical protein